MGGFEMIDRELLKQYAEKYRYNIEDVEGKIVRLIDGLVEFGVSENYVLDLIEKEMRSINYENSNRV